VRQKIQRAFAQELLSPIEGLKTMVSLPNPREGELEDAADHYGVSPWTVRSALVNRELVGREYLPR
jgi:Zn-dependent peptidase ImmA (M78 family)